MKSYDVKPIPRCTPSRAENNIELFKFSSVCRMESSAKRMKSYDTKRSPGCTPLRTEINIESLKLSSVPRRQTNTNAKRNVTAVTPDGIVNLDHASKKKKLKISSHPTKSQKEIKMTTLIIILTTTLRVIKKRLNMNLKDLVRSVPQKGGGVLLTWMVTCLSQK